MKYLLSLLCCASFYFCSNTLVFSQTDLTNDYVITSNGNVTELTAYTQALDVANWENYRLRDQRYQLSFENGLTIELKSAVELLNAGNPLDLNNYAIQLPSGYIPPTLELLSGNVIGMKIHSTTTKSH